MVLLAVWGGRFVLHRGEERIWPRSLLAAPALILCPGFASTHAVHDSWPFSSIGLGGSLGDAAARALLDLIPLADGDALWLLSLGLGLVLLVVGGAALGFTLDEVRRLARWLWQSLIASTGAVIRFAVHMVVRAAIFVRDRIRQARFRPRSQSMEPAEPTGACTAAGHLSPGPMIQGLEPNMTHRQILYAAFARLSSESSRSSAESIPGPRGKLSQRGRARIFPP